jgi:hypothetical protein
VTRKLTNTTTAPFYLVLCSPSQTTIVEKDLRGEPESRIRTSESFIVQTNHDNPVDSTPIVHSMEPGMDTTVERLDCMKTKWDELKRTEAEGAATGGNERGDRRLAVKEGTLMEWLSSSPVMNDLTHFSCVLDPSTAKIRWLARGDK